MRTFWNRSDENWFFKYKLYHIPFWWLYNYLWWVAQSAHFLQTARYALFSDYTVKFLFYVIFQTLAVCFNLYFLIPKYLQKGRFTEYFIYLIATILCAASLIVPGYYFSMLLSGKTFYELYGRGSSGFFNIFITTPLPSTIASMTLAMSIKLAKNWVQTQKRQQLLEKEKLETELNFLKYQFNPHFLFNTINSIFFLIHKNPELASASLAKFSDLLRYQLYECNEGQILLGKEITCLQNSIELERLRQNDNVEVSFQVNNHDADQLGIAPFILMTFVENAFKHVSKNSDKPNWIRIKLTVHRHWLDFVIANSTSNIAFNDVIHYGGIGLKNVQRRLDLIYPGQYELNINTTVSSFEVSLRLLLTTLAIPQPFQTTAAVYK